jgi:hypothetical protein
MLRSFTITAALGSLLLVSQPSWAQRFVFRPLPPRPVIVQPYYGWGPGWYGYDGWYGPYWGPAYVVPSRPTGEVKLITHMKDALVYVDGGYAGTAHKLKHFDLSPGNHNVELRDSTGRRLFQQQVQVIRGRTTEIHVD